MLLNSECYDAKMVKAMDLNSIKSAEITEMLDKYISEYSDCLRNKSQRKYFSTAVKGLLSDLDRKTVEPIALSFLGESDVRGFQQFFKRANLSENMLLKQYQNLLAQAISGPEGMLCVDGSDFAKKGSDSVGV